MAIVQQDVPAFVAVLLALNIQSDLHSPLINGQNILSINFHLSFVWRFDSGAADGQIIRQDR